jgi:coproporphyrinogen III oxidase-like Fe-S oxidoreductase
MRARAPLPSQSELLAFGDYLGIGAGAHGKCSRIEGGALRIERTWREREPRRYLAQSSRGRQPGRRSGAAPICRSNS